MIDRYGNISLLNRRMSRTAGNPARASTLDEVHDDLGRLLYRSHAGICGETHA